MLNSIACSGGADYALQLRPIVPQNQTPFSEGDRLDLILEHANGEVERHNLGNPSGSLVLEELGILQGTTIRLEVLAGDQITAVGRSQPIDLQTGQSEQPILLANLNDLAWLEDYPGGLYHANPVAIGNGRFLVFGGLSMNSASTGGRNGKQVLALDLADPTEPVSLEEIGEMPAYPAGINGENGSVSARHGASAALLTHGPHAGKVLVAGGTNRVMESQNITNSAFFFEPDTGAITVLSESDQMDRSHYLQETVMDASGNVVVLGGWKQGQDGFVYIQHAFDFFDASTGRFDQSTKNRTLRGAGAFGMAAVLGSTGVVHCGGARTSQGSWNNLPHCSLITSSGELSDEIPDMPVSLSHGEMIALSSTELLVVGGLNIPDFLEIGVARAATDVVLHYDHLNQQWTELGGLHLPRANAALGLLPDGRVLILGGALKADLFTIQYTAQEDILSCVEIYDPEIGLNQPAKKASTLLEGCTSEQVTSLMPTRAHSITTAQDPDFGFVGFGGLNQDGSQTSVLYWPFAPQSE
jgi:hypothetical protein